MKQKILYVFLTAISISMFSMAGQKKGTSSKDYCCAKLSKSKPTETKTAVFDLSPVGFLYIGVE